MSFIYGLHYWCNNDDEGYPKSGRMFRLLDYILIVSVGFLFPVPKGWQIIMRPIVREEKGYEGSTHSPLNGEIYFYKSRTRLGAYFARRRARGRAILAADI